MFNSTIVFQASSTDIDYIYRLYIVVSVSFFQQLSTLQTIRLLSFSKCYLGIFPISFSESKKIYIFLQIPSPLAKSLLLLF